MSEYEWWGYLHRNHIFQAKPWSGDKRDIEDAQESDFVVLIVPPFKFITNGDPRDYALKYIELKCEAWADNFYENGNRQLARGYNKVI